MYELSEDEINDLNEALEFFKASLIRGGDMDIAAASHYNAAMEVVKKLEEQQDEK